MERIIGKDETDSLSVYVVKRKEPIMPVPVFEEIILPDFKIKVATGEIKLIEDPQPLLRCQMEPSDPERALEQCFILKKEANELILENIGYEDIRVEYNIKESTRCFDLPNMTTIGIIGSMEFSLLDGKISVKSKINSGTLTLHYGRGASITMRAGDKVFDGEKLLIELESNTWGADWAWD